jgi:hypothetical protein
MNENEKLHISTASANIDAEKRISIRAEKRVFCRGALGVVWSMITTNTELEPSVHISLFSFFRQQH